jgi:hypothetical protein
MAGLKGKSGPLDNVNAFKHDPEEEELTALTDHRSSNRYYHKPSRERS